MKKIKKLIILPRKLAKNAVLMMLTLALINFTNDVLAVQIQTFHFYGLVEGQFGSISPKTPFYATISYDLSQPDTIPGNSRGDYTGLNFSLTVGNQTVAGNPSGVINVYDNVTTPYPTDLFHLYTSPQNENQSLGGVPIRQRQIVFEDIYGRPFNSIALPTNLHNSNLFYRGDFYPEQAPAFLDLSYLNTNGPTSIITVRCPITNVTAEILTSTNFPPPVVTNQPPPVVLTNLSIVPKNATIITNTAINFIAVGYYNNGVSSNLTTQVAWSSLNPAIATINNNGLALGLVQGIAFIKANYGGFNASTPLTVINSPTNQPPPVILTNLSIVPKNATIITNTVINFVAVGHYNNEVNSNLTTQVAWSSLNPAIATINNNGLALGLVQGIAFIKANYGGFNASTPLTVINSPTNQLPPMVTNQPPLVVTNAPTEITQTNIYLFEKTSEEFDVTFQKIKPRTDKKLNYKASKGFPVKGQVISSKPITAVEYAVVSDNDASSTNALSWIRVGKLKVLSSGDKYLFSSNPNSMAGKKIAVRSTTPLKLIIRAVGNNNMTSIPVTNRYNIVEVK